MGRNGDGVDFRPSTRLTAPRLGTLRVKPDVGTKVGSVPLLSQGGGWDESRLRPPFVPRTLLSRATGPLLSRATFHPSPWV